jgi:hypothetical protein
MPSVPALTTRCSDVTAAPLAPGSETKPRSTRSPPRSSAPTSLPPKKADLGRVRIAHVHLGHALLEVGHEQSIAEHDHPARLGGSVAQREDRGLDRHRRIRHVENVDAAVEVDALGHERALARDGQPGHHAAQRFALAEQARRAAGVGQAPDGQAGPDSEIGAIA